jgi:hypothetical protein
MTDEPKDREPIKPPSSDNKREVVRALAEGAASLAPGGSALTRLYRTTHPPKSESDRKQWQQAISERTNEHTDRLDHHDELLAPKETISGTATELATALARDCPDGMHARQYALDQLCALLPNAGRQAVEDAAFELNSFGLVEIQRFIGPHWQLRLTDGFYEQVDDQVMGWNSTTDEDARILARLILEDRQRERTQVLHEASGWDKRRFNPAFRVLTRLVEAGSISGEVQPHYPAASVSLLPEDRARMRRFVQSGASTEL